MHAIAIDQSIESIDHTIGNPPFETTDIHRPL